MKSRTLVLLALMALPAAWAEGQGTPRPAHRRMFEQFLKEYSEPPDTGTPAATPAAPAPTAAGGQAQQPRPQIARPTGEASPPPPPALRRDGRMLPWARQRGIGVHANHSMAPMR